jgi:hypothetical protein
MIITIIVGHTYTTESATTLTTSQSVPTNGTTSQSAETRVDHVHATVHVPVIPDAIPYVTGYGGPEIIIPDHKGGLATGEMTWVDIARCCAATPIGKNGNDGGIAAIPAERCISNHDLIHIANEYNEHRSPCKQDNLGWYKDTTHRVGEEIWKPRYNSKYDIHEYILILGLFIFVFIFYSYFYSNFFIVIIECCQYMKEFILNADKEFPDPKSLQIIQSIRSIGRNSDSECVVDCDTNTNNNVKSTMKSITEMSVALIKQYDIWNKGTCTDPQGRSSGLCCFDCLNPSINKLSRYVGYDSLITCGHNGEGWCSFNQKVPRTILQSISSSDPVSNSMKDLRIANTSKNNYDEINDNGKEEKTKLRNTDNQKKEGLTYDRTSIKTNTTHTAPPVPLTLSSSSVEKVKEDNSKLTLRLKELQLNSKILETKAENILKKAHSKHINLDSKTLNIVDRTKLTLLSERVGVMKMLKEKNRIIENKNNQNKQDVQQRFQETYAKDQNKIKKYENANEQIPQLLDDINEFIQSGQAKNVMLLEEEETE